MAPGESFLVTEYIECKCYCGCFSRLQLDGHGRWYSRKVTKDGCVGWRIWRDS